MGIVSPGSGSRGRASVKSRGDFMDTPLTRGFRHPSWMTEGQCERSGVTDLPAQRRAFGSKPARTTARFGFT